MAEKSIRVDDQAAGEFVATRDGHEQDSDLNDRVIQLMDFATRRHGWGFDESKIRAGVSSSDATLITTIPADILSSKLIVGDGQLLVAALLIQEVGEYDLPILTPIVIDDADNAVALLAPKAFSGVSPVVTWISYS